MRRPHKYPKTKKLLRKIPCFSRIKSYSNKKEGRFIPIDWSECTSPFMSVSSGVPIFHIIDNGNIRPFDKRIDKFVKDNSIEDAIKDGTLIRLNSV